MPHLARYLVSVRIAPDARKHQIADEDMEHAVRNALWSHDENGFTILIGAGRDGTVLEIGILDFNGDDPVIIHAMRARPKFL